MRPQKALGVLEEMLDIRDNKLKEEFRTIAREELNTYNKLHIELNHSPICANCSALINTEKDNFSEVNGSNIHYCENCILLTYN